MTDDILEILNNLNDNKITAMEATDKIKEINMANEINMNETNVNEMKIQCCDKTYETAKKIKIKVKTIDENGKTININLPKIPLRFAERLTGFALKFANKQDGKPISGEQAKHICKLISQLRNTPPFELADIEAEGTKVHIYTC